jgi:hypothetical protein
VAPRSVAFKVIDDPSIDATWLLEPKKPRTAIGREQPHMPDTETRSSAPRKRLSGALRLSFGRETYLLAFNSAYILGKAPHSASWIYIDGETFQWMRADIGGDPKEPWCTLPGSISIQLGTPG